MSQPAKADDIIKTLRQARDELQARGVQHAQLFGSVARGDHTLESDIDLAVTLDPSARISLLDFVGLQSYLAKMLGKTVV